ncbi:MAG: DNA/RNA nuclease SfsA [Proteobacteria bacterium]|nr:MAG: DNA/RNA nuclease SfsA [Pseudomonadota bacterium]
MKFTPPLLKTTLIKRHKRFLADVTHPELGEFTAHCPNTGSMKNCWTAGDTAWLFDSENPKRKYRYTWVINETQDGHMICINTHLANQMVMEGIENGVIKELQDYDLVQQEVKYGDENSRIDLLLTTENKPDCYVEIKTVTLLESGEDFKQGAGFFPDAVTSRGQKHLRELIEMKQQGHRAILFFLVQHSGIKTVDAAGHIDEKYADLYNQARNAGVEVLAYASAINTESITINKAVPVI